MRAFPNGAGDFFTALAHTNTRDWFTSHRDQYDDLIRRPLEALAATAESQYGAAHVMRPNRDVRFSTDKSPYKTSGSLWAGTVGGVYLQIDTRTITAGGGLYDPTRDQLTRARATIDENERAARALSQAVRRLTDEGYEFAGPDLTTAPRGYPRDHPAISLLRMRHYAATRTLPLDADTREIEQAWHGVQPLIDWTGSYVGPARSWP